MCKRFIYLITFLSVLLILGHLPAWGGELDDIDALIMTYQVGGIREAITLLKNRINKKPSDGNALWLLAKAHHYLGDAKTKNKLATFESGKAYADRAVKLLPKSAHAHFWQAALTGRIGQTKGILNSLFMVRPFKNAMEHVLKLDKNYGDAYCALSQLYMEAPGPPLSIGNKKLALENAEKAVKTAPKNVTYLLQLAKALDHNGHKKEALQKVNELLRIPAIEKAPPIKKEARALQARLSK